MKLLLHACCGPCSLEPTRLLKAAGTTSPFTMRTRTSIPPRNMSTGWQRCAPGPRDAGFEVLEGPYDPATWEASAGRIGDAAIAEIEQARAKAGVEGECAGEREGEIDGPNEASSNRCKTVTETNYGLLPLMTLPFSQAQQAAPPPAPPCCRSIPHAGRLAAVPAIAFAWRKPHG